MYIKRSKLNMLVIILMVFIALLPTSCSQSGQNPLDKNQDIPAGALDMDIQDTDVHNHGFQDEDSRNGDIQKADIHDDGIENSEDLYDYSMLYAYKNISLSDSDKMQELVGQLQYARELQVNKIIVVEGEESLRIDYCMSLTPGQQYKVDHTKMMGDVVILFALLDNLLAVEYNLVQGGYSYGGVPIAREQAEQVLGANIGLLGKTEETFLSEIPREIADLEWDPDVMDVITYEHIVS
jgi:hypothetical protein